jgi:hypothetical protein
VLLLISEKKAIINQIVDLLCKLKLRRKTTKACPVFVLKKRLGLMSVRLLRSQVVLQSPAEVWRVAFSCKFAMTLISRW